MANLITTIAYTPNLGLAVESNYTAAAKTNLYKIDQIQGVAYLDNSGNVVMTSQADVYITAATGKTIQIGDPNALPGIVSINASTIEFNNTPNTGLIVYYKNLVFTDGSLVSIPDYATVVDSVVNVNSKVVASYAHLSNTSNPHSTTAHQVGAYTEAEVDSLLLTKTNSTDFVSHTSNVSNPHSVTAAQVGAYTTTQTDNLLAAKASAVTVSSHIGNVSNPHSVTAAQVGAYTFAQTDTLLSAKATEAALLSHTGNVSNPHSTTAHQVGTYTSGEIAILLAGVGGGTVKISATDTTNGYLGVKLLAGTGITFTVALPTGNSTITASVDSNLLTSPATGDVGKVLMVSSAGHSGWTTLPPGVTKYANLAAFPSSGSNGDLGLALDTDIQYAYNTGSTSWVAISSPLSTTGTAINVINTLVARDGSGNFAAGTITASLSGNATTSSSCSGNSATATTATTATNVSTTTNNTSSTFYPVLAPANSTSGQALATSTLSYVPSTGVLTATTFSGALSGNATTSSSCSGNAATVTNGVYTSGDQTIGGNKTFSSKITGSISGNCDGNAATSSSCSGNAATASAVAWGGVTSKPDNVVAIGALTGPGFAVKTSTDPATVTWAQRTIAGTSNRISVSNGDGVSDNPTINLDTSQFPNSIAGNAGLALVSSGANTASWSTTQELADSLMSGLVSWGGAGNYYSIVGTTFSIIRSGVGRISGTKITWTGVGESVTISVNKSYYIGYSATHTLVAIDASTIYNSDTSVHEINLLNLFTTNVILFELWYDGNEFIVTKEDHPYSYPTVGSISQHFVIGHVYIGSGGTISPLVAADRTLQSIGTSLLSDHGLWTNVPDSTGVALTIDAIWRNASGIAQNMNRRRFTVSGISTTPTAGAVYTNNSSSFTVLYSTLTGVAPNKTGTVDCWTSSGTNDPLTSGTLSKSSGTGDSSVAFSAWTSRRVVPSAYSNAGIITPLTTGGATRYSLVAIYALKNDKNSTTIPYLGILSTAAYNTTASAISSLGTALIPDTTQFILPGEIQALEPVLTGFVLIDGNSTAGGLISNTTSGGFTAGVYPYRATTLGAGTSGVVSVSNAVNVSVDPTTFVATGGVSSSLNNTDTNVQLAFNTLALASPPRYTATLSWTGVGPYSMTITGATHGRGTDPLIRVRILNTGTVYSVVNIDDITIDASNGDVVLTSSVNFTGKVVIL